MKNQSILDSAEKPQSTKYSSTAFQSLIFSLMITSFFVLVNYFNSKGSISEGLFEVFTMLLPLLFIIGGIAGAIFSIKSLRNKEPNTAQKIIGLIGNSLILMIVLGLLSFVIVDMFAYS